MRRTGIRDPRLTLRRRSNVLLAGLGLALSGQPAFADPILFDFNSLADGAGNTAVQNYMRFVVPGVTVTGARAEQNYFGDNYVVGPTITTATGAKKVTPMTLGTSDYNIATAGIYNAAGTLQTAKLDSYLVNANGYDRITITFADPVYAVSFDFEIFPDGTCPNTQPNCNDPTDLNWPDFKFRADGVEIFLVEGVVPGADVPDLAGDIVAMADPTFAHSKISGVTRNEKAPQFLGTSGTWVFAAGVKKLEFVDWPRMIGIDNLWIDPDKPQPPQSVPEPGSLLLAALGLGLVGALARRRSQLAG